MTPSDTEDLVYLAYKKLKAHIYTDYNSLYLRSKLAEFESSKDFHIKLKKLATELDHFNTQKKNLYFDFLIHRISYHVLPKKIDKSKTKLNGNHPILVTNDATLDSYDLEKVMFVIDCPVELHILSVLWIMKIGKFLDSKIDPQHSFGNRLYTSELLDEHSDAQRRLFIPYFENYKLWRDTGINISKHLHANKIDSVILTLDIKNYYYSIDFDLNILKTDLDISAEYYHINNLLFKIHERYRNVLGAKNKFLPIGLLSSGILANYVLEPADKKICEQLKPAYYGRYVDDFIIVLANTKIKNDGNPELFLKECFKGYDIFKNEETRLKIISDFGNFNIQYSKVRLINVSASQPLSVIEEFEKNIKEASSEARLLVEEPDLLSNFDSESSKISYSDTIHKLRSVDAFNMDKLGASSYLTNLIEATKITHKISPNDISKFHRSVISYFSGSKGIESFPLWEKVITFYSIHSQYDDLFSFIKKLVTEILKIEVKGSFEPPLKSTTLIPGTIHTSVKEELFKWLFQCLAMAHALNPGQKDTFKETMQRIINSDSDSSRGVLSQMTAILMEDETLSAKAKQYRDSNLLRHKYINIPLINYCIQKDSTCLTDTEFNPGKLNFLMHKEKLEFSPRYIGFHEVQLFNHFKFLNSGEVELGIDQCVDEYISMNLLSSKKKQIKSQFPQFFSTAATSLPEIKINCKKQNFSHKITLAIANLSIDENDIVNSLLGSPNLHYNRLSKLNTILNMAARERTEVELIILPEAAVPIQWIDYLARFAQKHQIGIITGVEHFNITKNEVANFVCHILPFATDQHKNVCITFRNKENYSPEEKKLLMSNGKQEYKQLYQQCIYNWAGLHFTTFNCFEVTDLKKRANVVGLVDLLTVVENNKDTEYFSNIVESSARDIHCIVSQVNNSKYGDSRVCLPAKSYIKDQLRIRGGKNETILVEDLDIYGLRLYQMMGDQSFNLHNSCENYKPLPPNYLMRETRKLRKLKSNKKNGSDAS